MSVSLVVQKTDGVRQRACFLTKYFAALVPEKTSNHEFHEAQKRLRGVRSYSKQYLQTLTLR